MVSLAFFRHRHIHYRGLAWQTLYFIYPAMYLCHLPHGKFNTYPALPCSNHAPYMADYITTKLRHVSPNQIAWQTDSNKENAM